MRPEGLRQLKIPVTPSGIELATFRLVRQCLKYLSINESQKSPKHPYFSALLAIPPSQLQKTPPSNFLSNPLDICYSKGQQSHLGPSSCTCASHQRHLVHLLSLDLVTCSHYVSSNWMFCFCILATKTSHVLRIKPCSPIYASL